MKNILRLALFFSGLAVPPAQAMVAIAPAAYTCDLDGFSLTADGDMLHLTGILETPSPNYTYSITKNLMSDGYTLELITPDGMQLTVIDSIAIDHSFPPDKGAARYSFTIKKEFNWGPDAITCTLKAKEEQKK